MCAKLNSLLSDNIRVVYSHFLISSLWCGSLSSLSGESLSVENLPKEEKLKFSAVSIQRWRTSEVSKFKAQF